jgi:hypothetical protein
MLMIFPHSGFACQKQASTKADVAEEEQKAQQRNANT